MGKYADMHKVHDTLQAECQLLKDQMDEADTKSSQMRDISEVIQTEERSLLVNMLLFVTVILFIEFEIT
jgi:hypothetical protein